MFFRSLGRTAVLLGRAHYVLALFVVGLSLLVEEWLPFSSSPMYSRPSKSFHYFFISDLNDVPVPSRNELGVRCSRLRKAFHAYRARARGEGALDRDAHAASRTLQFAVENRAGREKREGYRLWRVDLTLGDQGVVREKQLVAEWP